LTFLLIFVIITLVKGLSGIGKSTLPFNRTNDTTMHRSSDPTNQSNQMNQTNQIHQMNQIHQKDGTEIYCKKKIVDSLIGKDVKIKERTDLPKGHRFIIGDSSEIEV